MNPENLYGLSPLQRGMLLECLQAREAGLYVTQFCWELDGALDEGAMRRAWSTVVARHEALRTCFVWDGLAEPLQLVERAVDLEWQSQDWRGRRPAHQRRALQRALKVDRVRGFDLERAPLTRVALFRTDHHRWHLLWTHHHLILDGWSVARVIEEVMACYTAYSADRSTSLDAPRPFADYIAWLQRQSTDAAEPFWRAVLDGVERPTRLGVERPGRRSLASGDGERAMEERRVHVMRETTADLQRLACTCRLTLSTIVLGGWALLLSRYSGQSDVVFGVATSGRPSDLLGVERIVGLLLNTLPVRARIAPTDTVRSFLERLQRQQVEARRFEYVPLTTIHGWSGVPRSTPLFESLLAFENYPVGDIAAGWFGSLRVVDVRSLTVGTYPLGAAIAPGPELLLTVGYDGRVFERSAIDRVMAHWERTLGALAEDSARRLTCLPPLGEIEEQQVLRVWNATARPTPAECMHHRFEMIAASAPDAIALVCETASISYRTLDKRANALAAVLRARGVGPEVRVSLCVTRGLASMVGVLGILKAGGVYVPMDPAYPRDRLAFMFEDARVSLVVTQSELRALLPVTAERVIDLDDAITHAPIGLADSAVDPVMAGHAAYVIYTSGSTSQPRGVVVTHRSATNLAASAIECWRLAARDVVLQFASHSYDAAVAEWMMTLCAGGRLVIPPATAGLSGSELAELLERHAVTVAPLLPSVLPTLPDGALRMVDRLLVGGEACPPDVARRWCEGREMWNAYGPTEATVFATVAGPLVPGGDCPIGRPIANMQAYILGPQGDPVPIGVAGDLYLGGVGLARGYLYQPRLTADRFVPNPFGAPGTRLYRTGDLARWRPDGQIDYLGRSDDQVQIRGFRVEPDEIAAALRAHDDVRDAVVVARDAGGRVSLIAYVVPRDGTSPSSVSLRAHLQARLPSYMLPAAFETLAQLPMLPNGKIDRHALPDPSTTRNRTVWADRPRNALEEILAEIWAEVLGVEMVHASDHFFELGGHSLMVTQLVSRIHHVFGVDLSMRAIFDAPLLSLMADAIRRLREERDLLASVPAALSSDSGPRALTCWRQSLIDAPILELPANYQEAASAQGDARRAMSRFALSPEQRVALARVAREHSVTRLMALVAACQLMLCDWTGVDDMLIGVEDRDRFVRDATSQLAARGAVPIRARIVKARTVEDWLGELRVLMLDADSSPDKPGAGEGIDLGHRRWGPASSWTPLLIRFQRTADDVQAAKAIAGAFAASEPQEATFSLTIVFVDGPSIVEGVCEYDSASFSVTSIAHRLSTLCRVLPAMAHDGGRKLGEVLLSIEAPRETIASAFSTPIDALLT